MKQDFDVDIVIPWVDGGDKEWQKEKNKYLPKENQIDLDSALNRYRDWENLKYIFRGIEKFAPWVRKVFFITCGQVPEWMNTECEKLVLVNHKDYIPSEYLPTFSSHPIELNMHRIKDLSEHFIYFNDDLFLIKPVKKEDFFKNGLPHIVAMEKPKTVEPNGFVFDNITMNNVRAIEKFFDKKNVKKHNKRKWYSVLNPTCFFVNKFYDYTARVGWAGFYIDHLPAPFLKSKIEKCWEVFYDELHSTSSHKFRSIYDVNQYIFTEYLLCTGCFSPAKLGRKGIFVDIKDNNEQALNSICEKIKNPKHKMMCLNDDAIGNFENTKNKINSALNFILPKKSVFEK